MALSHPGIVRVESLEDDPVAGRCIVMEFVEGVPLDVWPKSHPSVSQRRDVLRQLLSAIDHCHSRQASHRHPKPSDNLVTGHANIVKPIDLGPAAEPRPAALKQSADTRGRAAPEQRQGLPAHAEADIHAVGLILRRPMPRQIRRAAQSNPARRPQSAQETERLLPRRRPLAAGLTPALLAAAHAALRLLLYVPDTVYQATLPSGQEAHYRVLSHARRQVILVRPAAWESGRPDTLPLPQGPLAIPAALRHRHLPYRVTAIGEKAFADCRGLTSLTLPDGLERIEAQAFRGCSGLGDTLVVPPSLQWIGVDAFRGCRSLRFVEWRATSCESSGREYDYYFSGCPRLRGVAVHTGVRLLPAGLFGWMDSLATATLPEGLSVLPDYLFHNDMQLVSVNLPQTLTRIGEKAFYNCASLRQISIPDSVRSIGASAFFTNVSLTKVSLGSSLRSLGDKAFMGCGSVKTVTLRAATPPETGGDALLFNIAAKVYWKQPPALRQLLGPPALPVLRVPRPSVQQYRDNKEYRSNFAAIRGIEAGQ